MRLKLVITIGQTSPNAGFTRFEKSGEVENGYRRGYGSARHWNGRPGS